MEYYKVAAKWWADCFREVNPEIFNNGASNTDMAVLLTTILAMSSRASKESVDLFEDKLAIAIKEQVEGYGFMTLGVDYGPDYILATIAQEVGINPDGFPRKIIMWIEEDNVSVKIGYNEPKTIFVK